MYVNHFEQFTKGRIPMENENTIDAPSAAQKAMAYLSTMMPHADAILLEEVEKETENEKPSWMITLSFQPNLSGIASPGFRGLQFAMGKREYKTFKIDGATGEVISMKIKIL